MMTKALFVVLLGATLVLANPVEYKPVELIAVNNEVQSVPIDAVELTVGDEQSIDFAILEAYKDQQNSILEEIIKEIVFQLEKALDELAKKAKEVIEEQKKIWEERIEEAKRIGQERYEEMLKQAKEALEQLEKIYKERIEAIKEKIKDFLEKLKHIGGKN